MTSNGSYNGEVHEGEHDVEEEDPKDSVAAHCIRFTLSLAAGRTTAIHQPRDKDRPSFVFAPVYTHQCFPGEYIPGYHPLTTTTTLTTTTAAAKHSSFQHAASHRLVIDIALSPACDQCTVSLQKRPIKRGWVEEEDTTTTQSDNDQDANGSPPPRRLSDTEICAQLQQFLPPIVKHLEESSFSYLPKPVGSVVVEYTLPSSSTMDFCLTVCSGKDCADYHKAVQKLATWYIESASDIDPTEDGGAWKILYLFRKHDGGQQQQQYCYSLVGYMTLYHFESPLRKPVGGTIVRVCQALLLPCYQRMGHGKRMLHAVFEQCRSAVRGNHPTMVVEVNVEDPAPAFAALRDVVDWERYHQSGQTWFREACHDIAKTEFFAVLKDSEALPITVQALTSTRQIQTVYELDRLHRLQQHLQELVEQQHTSSSDRNDDDDNNNNNNNNQEQREVLEKRFRLMVKQRLNRQNREELAARCGADKVAAKRLLDDMFQAAHRHYIAILKHHGTK